jgi:hypothetical protein
MRLFKASRWFHLRLGSALEQRLIEIKVLQVEPSLLVETGRRLTGGIMADPISFNHSSHADLWPALDYEAARPTYETLHMWMQIVGKIRLAQTHWVNHSWHVPLYLSAHGLTTSPIWQNGRVFDMEFDFIEHRLAIRSGTGATRNVRLQPRSVADFYEELFAKLSELGFAIRIHTMPNEVPDAVPFDQDKRHASYDVEHAGRLWRALVQADRVFKEFRCGFSGKCSPVHFFWGSFDLAVTRFSGRRAPPHPGGIPNLPDWVAREAYSHEVSSCGFWPGGQGTPHAVFYAYAYPEPPGYADTQLKSPGAFYDKTLREFVLPYEHVRNADAPDAALTNFMRETYEAAADLGQWDRAALEFTSSAADRSMP